MNHAPETVPQSDALPAAADELSRAVDALLLAIEPCVDRTPIRLRPTNEIRQVLSAQIAYERARR